MLQFRPLSALKYHCIKNRTAVIAFQQLIETTGLMAKSRESFADAISKDIQIVFKETLLEKSSTHKKSLEFLAKYSDEIIQSYDEFEKVILANKYIT